MDVPLQWVPAFVDAVLQIVLAGVFLALGFFRRANRAFALFLGVTGGINLTATLGQLTEGTPASAFWWQLFPYFWLALPFAFVHFVLVYPTPRAGFLRTPWGAAPALAGMAAVDAAYLLDHGLVWGSGAGGPINGPLAWVMWAVLPPLLAGLALVLARDALREATPTGRRSTYVVAVAFGMQAAVTGFALTVQRVGDGSEVPGPGGRLAQDLALLAWAAGFTLYLLTLRRAAAERDEGARRSRRWGLAAVGGTAAVIAATSVAQLLRPIPGDPATFFAAGAVDFVFVLLVTYALVRHRAFGIQVRLKRGLQQSTVAAAFVAVYVVVSQGAQIILAPSLGPWVGLAAAALLVFAIVPLQGLAARLANAVMPGALGDGAAPEPRRLEAYRAAVEQAFSADGTLTPREAAMLARLRGELGITERDHAVMEHTVRMARRGGPQRLAFEPGSLVLGRYRVERLLGEGGAARTHAAVDEVIGRRVVLKALRPDHGSMAELLREARALAAVRHPNVVGLIDVERVGEEVVLVMEFVEGGSLADRLADGPLPPAEFHRVASGLLAALGAVHGAGMVHRDVKPRNVLLDRDGSAKLGDFGVAHLRGFETTLGGPGGPAVGTVRFMSPEQARGKRVTARSDLFSAAATLYEAHTGRPLLAPRPGETAVELQMRAAKGVPLPADFSGPPPLLAWFGRALDPSPDQRFGSAEEMAEALEGTIAASAPPGPRPTTPSSAQPLLRRDIRDYVE